MATSGNSNGWRAGERAGLELTAMMDLFLLRSFVAVVETGNFTRAGERLHLTQSTISQQIIRLEQSLGARLLNRSHRHVLPTEEGERLLGYAQRLLRLADEASAALGPAGSNGVVRLGVPEDLGGEALVPLLAAFAAERPRLRLEVECGLSQQLLAMYRNGELDLLLIKQWAADTDSYASWPEPLCWIDSAVTPVTRRAEAAGEPLPLVAFPVGALYRQEMIHALESRARTWRISYSSASLASLCAAVGAGLGVSLLPAGSVQPGHRVLSEDDGFPGVTGLKLVLFARSDLGAAGRSLRDKLSDLAAQRAKAALRARRGGRSTQRSRKLAPR